MQSQIARLRIVLLIVGGILLLAGGWDLMLTAARSCDPVTPCSNAQTQWNLGIVSVLVGGLLVVASLAYLVVSRETVPHRSASVRLEASPVSEVLAPILRPARSARASDPHLSGRAKQVGSRLPSRTATVGLNSV